MNRLYFDGGGYSFEMLYGGRSGEIVYKEGEKALKIFWEMSGVKELYVLVAPVDLRIWQTPLSEKILYEKQRGILGRFRGWLIKEGLKSDIDLPQKIEF